MLGLDNTQNGGTIDYAVIYLGPTLFAVVQTYLALGRVKLLESILIKDL